MRHHAIDIFTEHRTLEGLGSKTVRTAGAIGILFLVASVLLGLRGDEALSRFFHAYLLAFTYFLSLSLGALFFVILHHLVRAGWGVVVRRLAEGLAANLLPLAALMIPVLIGMNHLYHWTDAAAVAHDPLLQAKRPYLNVPFFVIRAAVYFGVWILLANFFVRRSIAQDSSGDPKLTKSMERFSGPAMVLYGLTACVAAFDLLMSLDPHWFSTIFGVYYFSGAVVGFFACLTVLVVLLQQTGRLRKAITPEHYHDLGKLIFAFTVFWAYIAFSQYMLIWYANLPEETGWLLKRQTNGWESVAWMLLVGHFIIPFAVLLPRFVKRTRRFLFLPAVWVLLMHAVDLYWLVMPQASPKSAAPHLVDLTCMIGVGGLYVAALAFRLRNRSLVPERDPRLPESLAFENA